MTFKQILSKLGLRNRDIEYEYLPDENNIEILNFYPTDPKQLFHYIYVMHHFRDLITPDNSLLIGSVFGHKRTLIASKSHLKLFYTCENVDRFKHIRDQFKDYADLAIGFDYVDNEKYQRFPHWLEYFFKQDANLDSIREVLSEFVIRDYCPDDRKNFASLVCSHDVGNIRTTLFNAMSAIDKVDSGGRWLNNTQALKEKFNDDKSRFIGQYKFNICPENTDREGYVTEKIFQAIRSNTIPVYWGGLNNPEPDVLNKDAILFYNGPKSLPGLMKEIETLHRNPKLYKEFMQQSRFQPHAAEYIAHLFDGLYTKMEKMVTKRKTMALSPSEAGVEMI